MRHKSIEAVCKVFAGSTLSRYENERHWQDCHQNKLLATAASASATAGQSSAVVAAHQTDTLPQPTPHHRLLLLPHPFLNFDYTTVKVSRPFAFAVSGTKDDRRGTGRGTANIVCNHHQWRLPD